ncbi:unnamed protein product [Rhizoctonia solani]|uniref:Uncharacterized protein n=1 Tax=Rhizoctonia solani TaxID=456999 RepID=A0A8H3HWN2_9AGAM|nr:unnamed protein product [Rhizoctonia solani]
MALSVPASGALRISQILPTIKCSKCNEDINIHYADEHVCNPNPTPGTPTTPSLPQEPASRVIDRASTASSISVPSVSSYSTHSRSSRSSSASTKRAPSIRSTHTIQQSPPADPPLRPQYKSSASFQSFRSQISATSVGEGSQQGSPPPRSGPSPAPTVRSNPVSPPVDDGATSPVQRSGPSPTPTVRSNPSLPPRDASPSPSSRAPSRMMAASPAPSIGPSKTPEPPAALPSVAPLVLRKFSRSSKDLPPQAPPPTHAPPPPDTSSGGEAGMAGVGRRAFAAAAHAALFTGHAKFGLPSPGLSPTSIYGYPGQIMSTSPTSPIDGRLSSLSGYLNISTDVAGGTPPLSPSYSPGSPSSATRPRSPLDEVSSPGAEIARATSRSPSPVDVIDGSGERSKGKGVAGGLSSLARQLRKDAANAPSTPTEEQPLHSASPEPMEEHERGRSRAMSNARSEAESETELAYGRSPSPSPERQDPSSSARDGDGEENTIAFPRRGSTGSDHTPKRSSSQSSSHSSASGSGSGSVSGTRRTKQSAGAQTLNALREEDEDDGQSTYTSPSSAEVGGTFKVTAAQDTEEPKLAPVTAHTLGMLGSDTDRLGLPTRSKTSASASSTTSSVRRKRVRTCAKCEKQIDDGRWVKIDGGNSVLCEQDWKMLYLPKASLSSVWTRDRDPGHLRI